VKVTGCGKNDDWIFVIIFVLAQIAMILYYLWAKGQ